MAAMAVMMAPGWASGRPETVQAHSGWVAFRDGTQCYAIAKAEPSTKRRTAIPSASVIVSPGPPGLHIRLSREVRPGTVAILDVGRNRFTLRAEGYDAFARDGQGANDAEIVAAMRRSPTMTLGARDRNGRPFRDHYRLEGVPTAMDAALLACSQRK